MEKIEKIGIIGGSFDPPHEAHLAMARKARDEFSLDQIIFVPCHQNPLKDFTGHASPHHRYVMCQLATLVEDDFPVTPIELNRGGLSYTIDTLREIARTGFELFLIIGMDSFLTINEWKDSHLYPELCKLIVFSREKESNIEKIPDEILRVSSFITGFDMNVSSTEIRKKVRSGEGIDRDVAPMVDVYIRKYELYKHFRDQNRLIDDQPKEFFIKGIE